MAFVYCPHCARACRTELHLKRHIQQGHRELNKDGIPCPLCSECCDTVTSLISHIHDLHSPSSLPDEEAPGYEPTHDPPEDSQPGLEDFDMNRRDISHSQTSQAPSINIVYAKANSDHCNLQAPGKVNSDPTSDSSEIYEDAAVVQSPIPCPNQRRKRRAKHTNEKPFICTVCGRTFARDSDRKNHEESHPAWWPLYPHPDSSEVHKAAAAIQSPSSYPNKRQKHPATFQCTLCPKRYTRAFALRAHLRNHGNEKPFVCTICDRKFARDHDRKTHEQLHSGQKYFVCKGDANRNETWGCGRRFARLTNLTRHFRSARGKACIQALPNESYAVDTVVRMQREMKSDLATGWDMLSDISVDEPTTPQISRDASPSSRDESRSSPPAPKSPPHPPTATMPLNETSYPFDIPSSATSAASRLVSSETQTAEMRTKVPKLKRTMTDIYSDELYSPNFTVLDSPRVSRAVGDAAEVFRRGLQSANRRHNALPKLRYMYESTTDVQWNSWFEALAS